MFETVSGSTCAKTKKQRKKKGLIKAASRRLWDEATICFKYFSDSRTTGFPNAQEGKAVLRVCVFATPRQVL